MSRIGRLPITIPTGVTITIGDDNVIVVKGAKGTLSQWVDPLIKVELDGNQLLLTRNSEDKAVKSKHGLYRALLQNNVTGVATGYERSLTLKGVGYKVVKQGKKAIFSVGYSHTVEFEEEEGISFEIVNTTEILLRGIDKTKIGQCAANIRAIRKPEPYHGYGIRYKDEYIQMKEGKTGK